MPGAPRLPARGRLQRGGAGVARRAAAHRQVRRLCSLFVLRGASRPRHAAAPRGRHTPRCRSLRNAASCSWSSRRKEPSTGSRDYAEQVPLPSVHGASVHRAVFVRVAAVACWRTRGRGPPPRSSRARWRRSCRLTTPEPTQQGDGCGGTGRLRRGCQGEQVWEAASSRDELRARAGVRLLEHGQTCLLPQTGGRAGLLDSFCFALLAFRPNASSALHAHGLLHWARVAGRACSLRPGGMAATGWRWGRSLRACLLLASWSMAACDYFPLFPCAADQRGFLLAWPALSP